MMFLIILVVFYINIIRSCENEIEVLSANFKETLRADPFLQDNADFQSVKLFIDKKIDHFGNNVVWRIKNHTRSKRSLSDMRTLVDIKVYRKIPVTYPQDIIIFFQKEDMYAIVLEEQGEIMKIKKSKGDSFISIVERKITKSSKVAAFSRKSATIIVVAINSNTSRKWSRKNVFIFHSNEKLEPIQIVNTSLITDIAMWEDQSDLFMSGCSAADFPLYKWRGQHFDVVQTITGAGTKKITPFTIHNVAYIALASTEPSDGSGRTFSHILRYDFKTKIYKLYQRLETFGCIDIKYFQIISERKRWEHFVILGNGYQEDHFGNITYNTRSIIYKYIEGYFIPFQSIFLNGLREWLPIEIENGDAILLALTLDGLRSFHYDGWSFNEGQVRFLDVVSSAAFRDVTHINSYKIENKTVLVLAKARGNGLMENMFTITLTKSPQLEREYDGLLQWCLKNTMKVKNIASKNVGEARGGDDDQVLVIESQLGLNHVDIMKTTLEAYESRLSIIRENVQRILLINNNQTIQYNMTISNLIFHNIGGLKKLHTEKINKIPVNDVLTNTLDINKGFNKNLTIEFTFVQVEETMIAKYINDMELSRLEHIIDNMEIDEMSINGTISCEQETVIKDNMNDMLFDNSHLLKSEEDQVFDIIKNIPRINIIDMTVNDINNVDLQVIKTNDTRRASIRNAINELETFKVQELTIGGSVNDLDIGTINTCALRQGGDQVISKTHLWELVDTDNINIQNLSGKKLEHNIVTITTGNYTINKDVKFKHDLNVDSLMAFKFLAGLSVKDGRLDIILRDSEEMQYIFGTKCFENLHILNPVNLQGRIKGEPFDAINPAVEIDSALEVNDVVTKIAGNVIIEELIITKDIVGMRNMDKTNTSLFRVIDLGIKVFDDVVSINLKFSKHINVKELFTGMINNLNPNEWLVTGGKEAQKIRYEKYFPGDLEITGDIDVRNMNNVDKGELQTNVLRKYGDQRISGKHKIKYLATENKILTNNIKFGEKKWTDVVTTSGPQEITGPVIFVSNVVSTSLKVTNLEARGLTNDLSFVDLVNDAYTYNSDRKLLATKKFANLTIEDLFITKVNQHLVSLASGVFILKYLMNMQAMSVKNIHINDKFNSIDKELIWKHENSNKTLTGLGYEFGTITIHGQVFLKSNHVNHLDMQDFQNKTVKTDEEFEFDSAKIDRAITRDAVQLDGQIENLDLNTVFLNMEVPQHFANEKVSQGNISVLGNVRINDSLNNIDISNICGYESHTPKPLIFEGNILFAKGPDVFVLNAAQAINFIEKVWYSDRPAIINGNVRNSNSSFMDIITVQGIVNDFDVNFLLKSYMSKTRDQIVEAQMNFNDELTFEEDIASPDLHLNGNVNKIHIKNLPYKILLNRAQVFEGILYLEKCKVMSVSGDYLVNTWNLEREVMRYDGPNFITGPKRFRNIKIDILRTFDRNIVVQNVDMNYWLANAIQTTGHYRISENKLFGNATFEKGIGVKGTMNGLKFSKKNIMSKTEPQITNGRKLFTPLSMDIKFKVLQVKGYLNEIDVGELIHNQASMNGINVFRSPIVFRSNVTTKNINFRSLYQGINITEFIRNVTMLESLNDLSQYYEDHLDMSNKIESSLEDQASYLNYFKRVYLSPRNATLYPSYKNKKTTIMSLTNENGSFTLNFLDWNENINIFEDVQGYSIRLGVHPSFFEKVSHGKRDYIYLEYPTLNANDKPMLGKLIHIENSTNLHSFSFQTKGTTYLTSFYMEIAENNCLLFIDYSKTITIMCADSNIFHFHQDIPLGNVSKATTMSIDSNLYLIALSSISSEENHVTTWKLNNCTLLFEHHQTIQVARGLSMDTVSFFNNHFLAIVHGYLENTLDFGQIEILKFDRHIEQFTFYQEILAAKPYFSKFASLPSRELVLYILSSSHTLNVYIYEGIAGFTKKAVNTRLRKVTDISHFNTNNHHFVILKCNEEIEMLEAIFKGQYVEDQRFQ